MLEQRVAALEADMREMKGILARIEKRLDSLEAKFERFDERLRKVEGDVRELSGRVSQLPSTWQMVALFVAQSGLMIAVLRFGLPGTP